MDDCRREIIPAVGTNAIRLPDEIVAPVGTAYCDLAKWVFGDVVQLGVACARRDALPSTDELHTLSLRAVLAPTNSVAQAFNDKIIAGFPAASICDYLSTDRIDGGQSGKYTNLPVEFLKSLMFESPSRARESEHT